MNYKIWSIDRARSNVKPDTYSNDIVDIVLAQLLLNTKQEIIIYEKMRYTIYNQVTLRLKYSNQLLFIIRGKDNISKNQVIKAIS